MWLLWLYTLNYVVIMVIYFKLYGYYTNTCNETEIIKISKKRGRILRTRVY